MSEIKNSFNRLEDFIAFEHAGITSSAMLKSEQAVKTITLSLPATSLCFLEGIVIVTQSGHHLLKLP